MSALDEARMTIKTLSSRGATKSEIARLLGVTEGAVRYHVTRMQSGALDGRSRQEPKAAPVAAAIDHWRQMQGEGPINLAVLHEWLVLECGYSGSLRSIQRHWARTYPAPAVRARRRVGTPPGAQTHQSKAALVTDVKPMTEQSQQARLGAFEWMLAILQKKIRGEVLHNEIGYLPDFALLTRHLHDGRLSDRNRSLVILASHRGIASGRICAFLDISKKTYQSYLHIFQSGGAAALFARRTSSSRKFDNEVIKNAVFSTLHEPPGNYGINRASWKMGDLCQVLGEMGQPVCPQVIRKITKAAGYRWRKARVVLTSSDPAYSEKLDRIRSILSGLQPDEAFFSIDEYGPFAVKMQPGRALTAPGDERVVPQWQKPRGCLIVIAALELSGNQVTHFYSTKKNTAEMIRMMETLIDRYSDRRRLYLSWDAASWHISKRLYHRIEEHNSTVVRGGGPVVETAPLPTGAQFLNVIESVFSGMARAIVHGSNYPGLDDAKAAIDRYFEERNAHFRQHPKRAGNKIWRKEREPASFSAANNCKDPRYR
jgi:transposase